MKARFTPLLLAAALSACGYQIKTADVAFGAAPAAIPADVFPVGVAAAGIDVSEAQQTAHYSDFRKDLYATFMSTMSPSGLVAPFSDQKLHLIAALRFKVVSPPPGPLLGVLSFYIPPLGFIPYDSSEVYSVTYSIRDGVNNNIYARSLDGGVAGSIQGWFVGRIFAQVNLADAEGAFAAKNAARLILQDLSDHSHEIAEAVQRYSGEEAAPRRAAPFGGSAAPAAANEWWKNK